MQLHDFINMPEETARDMAKSLGFEFFVIERDFEQLEFGIATNKKGRLKVAIRNGKVFNIWMA